MQLYRVTKPIAFDYVANDLLIRESPNGAFLSRFGSFYLKSDYLECLEKVELKVGMEFILAYPRNIELSWKDAVVVSGTDKIGSDGSICVNVKSDYHPLGPYLYHLRFPDEVSASVVEKRCTCDIMALMRVGCKCGGI